jgi:hypothetical protein
MSPKDKNSAPSGQKKIIHPPDFMSITIIGTEVVINDYSEKDDRNGMLCIMQGMGLNPKVTNESYCG